MNINELRLAVIRKFGFATDEVVVVSGIMGVPISFLDKYCPEQFEILGMCASAGYDKRIVGLEFLGKGDARPLIGGKNTYARIFIRRKKGQVK